MILVTSAYGQIGKRICKCLCANGLEVRAMDINPEVENLKEMYGVKEVFVGDALKPEVMAEAMKGITKVVYQPAMAHYNETRMAKVAIDAAIDAKVEKFVLMSVVHPMMSSCVQHICKLLGEEYLIQRGLQEELDYTILQPMHYSENFNIPRITAAGEFVTFHSTATKIGNVDADDVAEVVYKMLTEPGHEKATYELCGPSRVSYDESIAVYNKLTGKDYKARCVDVEEFIQMMGITDTYTQEVFRQIAGQYNTYGMEGSSKVLEWLLGRKPTDLEGYVRNRLAELEANS